MGYTNVRDYVGGKQDWIRHGLPAEGVHFDHKKRNK